MATIENPYLPAEFATLAPNNISEAFWDRCVKHELAFQRCDVCGAFRNPPAPMCHECAATETTWTPVAGSGTIYSYTRVTHPVHPALDDQVPFNVVLVEFDDAPGVRLVSNLIDSDGEDLWVGMAVALIWEDVADGVSLPRFQRADR
jgi:uncharacterized OB-fold protein